MWKVLVLILLWLNLRQLRRLRGLLMLVRLDQAAILYEIAAGLEPNPEPQPEPNPEPQPEPQPEPAK